MISYLQLANNVIKIESLKSRKQFQKLFSSGKKFFDNNANIVVVFRTFEEFNRISENHSECLITTYFVPHISKRSAKKAVIRNRIKRLIRESLRSLVNKEDFQKHFSAVDTIFISWQKAPSHPGLIALDTVNKTIVALLEKAYSHFLSNHKDGKI